MQQYAGAGPSAATPPPMEKVSESTLHPPSRRTRRPAPSPCRSSSGRHAGRAARSTKMAATLKPAPSPCTGDRVSRGLAGGSWSEFCAKVAALRPGRLWRYAQAGDLPGYGAEIDGALLDELVAANTGKNAIAFTHKPVLGDDPVAVENRRLDRCGRQGRLHGQPLGRQPRACGQAGRAGDRPRRDRARPSLRPPSSSAPVQEAAR